MVAISILGVAALAEAGLVTWALIAKFRALPPAQLVTNAEINRAAPLPQAKDVDDGAPTAEPLPVSPAAGATGAATASPGAAGTAAAVAAATATAPPASSPEGTTAVASLPRPTPVPQTRATTTEARIVNLLEQARALRERGDTSTAITRLREALAIAPQNTLLISELAMTYEKMGVTDKALEQWRRIYDLGESAGIYYQAADAKLKSSERTGLRAGTDPADASSGDNTGIQPGSVLGLGGINLVDAVDPNAAKKFTLKIPLKSRPNMQIDVSDVVIQVFFYDSLPDDSIVQTSANVSSQWSTLPADWGEDDIEILEVNYNQPKGGAGRSAAEGGEGNRRYYGYIVRIYYKRELQDMRAEPITLLKRFPPPLTISSTTETQ